MFVSRWRWRLDSYAASSTTVAKKNSVLLSLEMTTPGSKGVSSSSSLLPDAVFVGSSMPGVTNAAAPRAVSANLATEYPLRDLSQKPLKKASTLSMLLVFHGEAGATLIQQKGGKLIYHAQSDHARALRLAVLPRTKNLASTSFKLVIQPPLEILCTSLRFFPRVQALVIANYIKSSEEPF